MAGAGHGGGAVGLGSAGAATLARDLGAKCRVRVPGVYFEFDSDELNPASAPWIKAVADLLRLHPEWSVTVEGHTDSIGGHVITRISRRGGQPLSNANSSGTTA
jgi:outer membrane protein OmpA-like peptidoglycan-associated protein